MDLTLTSFLTTLMISSIIILLLVLLISKIRLNKIFSANIFMGLSVIFLLRLCIPVEFPFTRAIPSAKVLPSIYNFLDSQVVIRGFPITFKHFLMSVWVIGSSFFLIRLGKKIYAIHLLKSIFKRKVQGEYKKIKVAKVDIPISPVVIGLINPLIVIPNITFSSREMQFVLRT